MKVLLILPTGTKKTCGNWITAERLEQGLKSFGIINDIKEVKDVNKAILEKYDIVHCFHAVKTSLSMEKMLNCLEIPWVVTFTGTDLEALYNPKMELKLRNLLYKARTVFVFHKQAKTWLNNSQVVALDKIKVIPQTIMPLQIGDNISFRSKWNISDHDFVFLFAGGIREVKGPLEALELIEPLAEKRNDLKLIMAGPILEPEVGQKLFKRLSSIGWAEYIGEVSHHLMSNLFHAADVVINTSRSEGMPNTLLEAMSMGCAILAKDIPGNRAVVRNGVDGFLFKNNKDFFMLAKRLMTNEKIRFKVVDAALKRAEGLNPQIEAQEYLKAYRKAENISYYRK